MKIQATGLTSKTSRERAVKGGRDLSAILSQRWWSTGLSPGQMSTLFNRYVLSKEGCGLAVAWWDEETENLDRRWSEAGLKALIKTLTPLGERGRRKLVALFQVKISRWLV